MRRKGRRRKSRLNWPLRMASGSIIFILRLMAVFCGCGFLILGFLLTISGLGGICGLPFIVIGFSLVLRGLF